MYNINNLNSLTYKGFVKIKYIDNKSNTKVIKQHNNGEEGLQDLFVRALYGQNNLSNYIPSYIKCFTSDNKYATSTKIYTQSNAIVYSSSTQTSLDNSNLTKIQYSFTIPNTVIISSIHKVVLYNNNNLKCAEVTLSNDISKTSVSSNMLLYWQLMLI